MKTSAALLPVAVIACTTAVRDPAPVDAPRPLKLAEAASSSSSSPMAAAAAHRDRLLTQAELMDETFPAIEADHRIPFTVSALEPNIDPVVVESPAVPTLPGLAPKTQDATAAVPGPCGPWAADTAKGACAPQL